MSPSVGNQAWSDAERADSAVCASFLRTGVILWGALTFCCLLSFKLMAFRMAAWALLPAWSCWGWGTWLAIRVMLDAHLFGLMACRDAALPSAAVLDGALMRVLGVKRDDVESLTDGVRGMKERIAGAKRLYLRLVIATLCESVLLLGLHLRFVLLAF